VGIVNKAKTELAYFQQLAPLAGIVVDVASIRQRGPPAPDIECALVDGDPFSAELVALDDPATRTRLTNMMGTKASWYEARDTWSTGQQIAIEALSRDLSLSCLFDNAAGQRVRRQAFVEVQRFLLNEPGYAGDLTAHLRAVGVAGGVRQITAHRGGSTGVRISAPTAGGWFAPNYAALLGKLTHPPYQSAAPVHLFAYSEHDNLDASVTSLADLEALVRQHLPTSNLSAVHFFDLWGPTHLLSISR